MRLALLFLALIAQPVGAATCRVDTTSAALVTGCTDAPADCSHNGAVTRANGAAGADVIAFDIPSSDPGCVAETGVCRIQFAGSPTGIDGPTTIDGYTQPGAVLNTLTADQGGTNALFKIELRGCPSCSSGVILRAVGTIGGLAIGGFGSFGIALQGSNSVVEGNFLGTDASVLLALPHGRAAPSCAGWWVTDCRR
jgi:hypothetical protein